MIPCVFKKEQIAIMMIPLIQFRMIYIDTKQQNRAHTMYLVTVRRADEDEPEDELVIASSSKNPITLGTKCLINNSKADTSPNDTGMFTFNFSPNLV